MKPQCNRTFINFCNILRTFFSCNKKFIICFSVLFAVGIIVGISAEINACAGEFEVVLKCDIVYSAVKVFFFSALYLIIGYAVILFCGVYRKFMFLSVVPFFLIGLFLGKHICLLTACYGSAGIFNLLIIYLPFFLSEFICLMVFAVTLFRNCCSVSASGNCCGSSGGSGGFSSQSGNCGKRTLSPLFIAALKWYGLNIAICFVIFIIFGIGVKVIIVM